MWVYMYSGLGALGQCVHGGVMPVCVSFTESSGLGDSGQTRLGHSGLEATRLGDSGQTLEEEVNLLDVEITSLQAETGGMWGESAQKQAVESVTPAGGPEFGTSSSDHVESHPTTSHTQLNGKHRGNVQCMSHVTLKQV